MTTSSNFSLSQGTLVIGRWKGGKYVIQRLLGRGANGIVYLVKQADRSELYAMKMGFDLIDIQSEINVLQALQRHTPSYLIEVDDYCYEGSDIPFYIMRYVKGERLSVFLTSKGSRWLSVAGLSTLQQLQRLHEAGWTFGDLKPDNILVSSYGDVELIDYGGVSAFGRSVKQFTAWYDRGYWGAGSRTADPAYDWFSFAVVCIHMLAEEPLRQAADFLPQTRSKQDLLAIVRSRPELQTYRKWLERAIDGRFKDTKEACDLWREVVRGLSRQQRPKVSTPGWMVSAFTLSLTLLACALYLTFKL